MSTVSRGLRAKIAAATALATGGLALAAVPIAPAHAADSPTTVQVSVRTGGFQPGVGANNHGAPGESRQVSQDGRYVVYAASGPVVPGQPALQWQVVRRDRHLGTTELISKSSSGAMGNGGSTQPSISSDGQTVAFHSYASNLVAGDTNGHSDVFVHDVRTGTTSRASVTSAGSQVTHTGPGTNPTGPPSISANGRYVGFSSSAVGLAAGDDTSTQPKAYLHDRTAGTTEVVSRNTVNAVVGVLPGSAVSPSADGQRVAFYSGAEVVPGDLNSDPDVFIRNRGAGTTVQVSAGEDGSSQFTMSADGNVVAFHSTSDGLVPGTTHALGDLFVHDFAKGTTERINVASNGTAANGRSLRPALSADGRYVAFVSDATNLVPGDTNGSRDVFRHDRQTRTTVRASVNHRGAQSTDSRGAATPSISGDGQHVAFESYDRSLTPAGTQGYGQVFVRDLTGKYPALFARLGKTPNRVIPRETYRVSTVDIRTGPALRITWTPASGKGKVVNQTAAVKNNAFTLRAPNRRGKFTVTVQYAGNLLGTRTIRIPKPAAKMPKRVKKNKRLKVTTTGVKSGQRVQVIFRPKGKTRGKQVRRAGKVNKNGVLRVKPAPRRGVYRVVVRTGGKVIGKRQVRVR